MMIQPHPEVSPRTNVINSPALIQGLSADEDEIVVDWSSGTAKSNISGCTDSFVDNVVERSRSELRARKQADDLLGKLATPQSKSFIIPASQPPLLESVGRNDLTSSNLKPHSKSGPPALSRPRKKATHHRQVSSTAILHAPTPRRSSMSLYPTPTATPHEPTQVSPTAILHEPTQVSHTAILHEPTPRQSSMSLYPTDLSPPHHHQVSPMAILYEPTQVSPTAILHEPIQRRSSMSLYPTDLSPPTPIKTPAPQYGLHTYQQQFVASC